MNDQFYLKYIKYKTKYLELKGGLSQKQKAIIAAAKKAEKEEKNPFAADDAEGGADAEGEKAMKFTLGGTEGYTNKINFTLPTLVHGRVGKITKFTLEEFNEILLANKEFKAGKLSISVDGLLKLEFINEEGVIASYILVGKE